MCFEEMEQYICFAFTAEITKKAFLKERQILHLSIDLLSIALQDDLSKDGRCRPQGPHQVSGHVCGFFCMFLIDILCPQ